MIYFDNAATSFPKPRSVIDEVNRCIRKYCGNPGRSSHKLSIKSAEIIYSARESVADLLHDNTPENVVFTYNATYALNIAIKSFVTDNCHVLTSYFEHNSVIRPLEALKESKGLEYDIVYPSDNLYAAFKDKIKNNTKGIVCSVASNVTGDVLDIEALSRLAIDNNLFLIIDASAAVGHKDFDLSKTPCDAFCAPGHKALYGIQGSGFILFRDNKRRQTLIEGGSGTESLLERMPLILPEGYEAGTLSTPAVASLMQGISYVRGIGLSEISRKLDTLTDHAEERLLSIPRINHYKKGCGIISFNLGSVPSDVIAGELAKHGICTRAGLHCAPSIHRYLNTIEQGAVRLSFSWFNNKSEIDRFYRILQDIEKTI